jgi:hypothetical protein
LRSRRSIAVRARIIYPTIGEMRTDLPQAGITGRIRTYIAHGALADIPRLAVRHCRVWP